MTHDEQVMVVDARLSEDLLHGGVQGYCAAPEAELWRRLLSHGPRWCERAAAEHDTTLLQVIPYVVVTYRGCVLCYRRTATGGEARLHQQWSIGVGGHVNPCDVPRHHAELTADNFPEVVANAAVRELVEELDVSPQLMSRATLAQELRQGNTAVQTRIGWSGFVLATGLRGFRPNQPDPRVEQVHVGVVGSIELGPHQLGCLSEDVADISWLSAGTIFRPPLELWSELVWPELPYIRARTMP